MDYNLSLAISLFIYKGKICQALRIAEIDYKWYCRKKGTGNFFNVGPDGLIGQLKSCLHPFSSFPRFLTSNAPCAISPFLRDVWEERQEREELKKDKGPNFLLEFQVFFDEKFITKGCTMIISSIYKI